MPIPATARTLPVEAPFCLLKMAPVFVTTKFLVGIISDISCLSAYRAFRNTFFSLFSLADVSRIILSEVGEIGRLYRAVPKWLSDA